MDAKNDGEKDMKNISKRSQNDPKMYVKIDEKSIRFLNLRFLVFF